MPNRFALAVCLCGLAACSFIDDFDRFQAAHKDAGGSEDDGAVSGEDGGGEDAGDDAGGENPDAGVDGDGAVPAGDLACRGKADGVSCGDGQLICRKGFCRTSRCGDGFVDSVRGEQCDDANLTFGDGCEPSSCRFSCEDNTRCDNGYPCDGEEKCDITSHRCVPDTVPATSTACQRAMRAGVCDNAGFCITPGCGNHMPDPGEECDPALNAPRDGCRADCTRGCTSDMACDDGNACNGVERCDLASATCKPGTKLVCVDTDPCSDDDACDPMRGCTFPLLDADGDRVSEQTCSTGSRFVGGDCDGRNASIYPGAIEYCDNVDNDCDGMRDEGAVMATCYPDADGDGFPAMQGALTLCSCGAGTRLARADGAWDCNDDPQRSGGDVYPLQDAYFSVGYEVRCSSGNGTCVSFDYNCNTAEDGQYPAGSGSCGLLGVLCTGEGYNGAAPACGREGQYVTCVGGGLLSCGDRPEQRRQLCR